MRIAVVGAGIAGITTAYELARDGHQVTILERGDSIAAQASFANAGLLSPALMVLAPQPGTGGTPLTSAKAPLAELRWQPQWNRSSWRWLRRWQRVDAAERLSARRRALLELLLWGLERHRDLATLHQLNSDTRKGLLVLGDGDIHTGRGRWAALRSLEQFGVTVEPADAERCLQIEPGLSAAAHLVGGLHLPQTMVGNCREFAHQLRLVCERDAEVRLHLGTRMTSIRTGGGGPILSLSPVTSGRSPGTQSPSSSPEAQAFLPTQADPPPPELEVDAVVLACGLLDPALSAITEVPLPIQPVWGRGVSFRLRDDLQEQALRSAVIEEDTGITLTRLGQWLRVTGGWEMGDSTDATRQAAFTPLYEALDRWFPLAAQRRGALLWHAPRPMLPDGLPVIGPSGVKGVWLQLGHGGLGWSLACAAARLLADQIAGRSGRIDPAPFSALRWA